MDNPYDEKQVKRYGLDFTVSWCYDELSSIDDTLGQYSQVARFGAIDCETGYVLGKVEDAPEQGEDDSDESFEKAKSEYKSNHDDDTGRFILGLSPIYRRERDSLRYFHPINPVQPGSLSELTYAIQDHRRAENWGTEWQYVGCGVSIQGLEEHTESLWGIESDMGDKYKNEVEEELIEGLYKSIPTIIADVRRKARQQVKLLQSATDVKGGEQKKLSPRVNRRARKNRVESAA